MINIKVGATTYQGFTSAQVSLGMDRLCSTFEFTATTDGSSYLPFKGGEECEIFVDGDLVLSGTIEVVDAEYTNDSHRINISGRDYTGDLLDSSLDSLASITGDGLTLKSLIESVLDQLNIGVDVIDNANPKPFNVSEDYASPELGENAFSFLEKYSRKRQVLLGSDELGNVTIIKSEGDTIQAWLRHEVNGSTNNILSANVSYDRTGRFNVYKFASSLNPIAVNNSADVSVFSVASQVGNVVVDDEISTGRQLYLVAETSASDGENTDRAKWERNVRRSRGRMYSAKVHGYRSQTGGLWTPGTVVGVLDERADIDGQMLVNTVTYDYSLSVGSQTTIGLLPPDAYTLASNTPVAGSTGNALTS